MPFLPNGMSTINRLSETFMHRFYSALCAIAAAVLLGACDNPGTSAPSNAGPATGDPTPISNLPLQTLATSSCKTAGTGLQSPCHSKK